jgi:hypothetical protein
VGIDTVVLTQTTSHLSRNPDKMAEFSAYLRNVGSCDTVALRHLTVGFAWEGIREDGVVVDVDAGLHLVNVVQPFGSALLVSEVILDE